MNAEHEAVTEQTIEDCMLQLLELVMEARDDADDPANDLAEQVEGLEAIQTVATYADVGMMTRDNGLVIRTADGREFQLTIVRSR